jgi:hypothetical protein
MSLGATISVSAAAINDGTPLRRVASRCRSFYSDIPATGGLFTVLAVMPLSVTGQEDTPLLLRCAARHRGSLRRIPQ